MLNLALVPEPQAIGRRSVFSYKSVVGPRQPDLIPSENLEAIANERVYCLNSVLYSIVIKSAGGCGIYSILHVPLGILY